MPRSRCLLTFNVVVVAMPTRRSPGSTSTTSWMHFVVAGSKVRTVCKGAIMFKDWNAASHFDEFVLNLARRPALGLREELEEECDENHQQNHEWKQGEVVQVVLEAREKPIKEMVNWLCGNGAQRPSSYHASDAAPPLLRWNAASWGPAHQAQSLERRQFNPPRVNS